MKNLLIVGVLLLAMASVSVRAECDDGVVKKVDTSETSENSEASDVSLWFKNVGCSLQKSAVKVQEGAKKLGGEIKERAKKFKESAKKFGSDLKTKYTEWKEKINQSSEESTERSFLADVEIINPDILKGEQLCGKGFILDALGDCKKN